MERADGSRLSVWVHPGRARNQVRGARDGYLVLDIKAPAEDGRANDALCAFVAGLLGVRLDQVRLVTGAHHRRKGLAIGGLTPAETTERLLR